jgi:putative acetyltransferase
VSSSGTISGMSTAIRSTAHTGDGAALSMRRAGFQDVNALLRLIDAAVEHGCREHYSPAQRRAVFLTYAESLFVDVLGPYDTIIAERQPNDVEDIQIVGAAQLDPAGGRLRALFVAPALQGQGLGRVLLSGVERLARARGLRFLEGAMSLNAVPFYRRAGFQARRGPEHLVRAGVVVPILDMQKSLGAP